VHKPGILVALAYLVILEMQVTETVDAFLRQNFNRNRLSHRSRVIVLGMVYAVSMIETLVLPEVFAILWICRVNRSVFVSKVTLALIAACP
jgi:hypothetical protein